MKTYECEKCLKQFRQKIDYTRHLNRKFPCKKLPQFAEFGKNLPILANNNPENACEFCHKIFGRKYEVKRHHLICKSRKEHEHKEQIEKLKSDNAQALVIKTEKISCINKTKNINSNNNIQNNTTNNNILLSFKDTDMTHMTIPDWEKIMLRCCMSVPACVKKLHFDPNKPENKNIIKSNLNNKFLKCYENNKWETCNQNDKIDKIYNSYSTLLEELADKWEEDEVKHSSRAVLKLRRFLEKQEDPNVYNRILHELILIFYNNR